MILKADLKDEILTVYPKGRITADLAYSFEKSLTDVIDSNIFASLILDFSDVEYIASLPSSMGQTKRKNFTIYFEYGEILSS